MRDFCRAFIFAASSRMSPASSGENSARVRQSRPERGEGRGGFSSRCWITASGYGGGLDSRRQDVNTASKGIERSSYLRSAHGERRGEPYGAADLVYEDSFLQTVLEDCFRELGIAEVQAEQEPLSAHLRAGNAVRKHLQCALEDGPLEPNLFEELWGVDDAEDRLDCGHGERAASEGGAVISGFEGSVLFLRYHRTHRHPTAEALGAREHVRDDPDALVGVEVAGASRPGLDLVEDEEGAYLVAEITQSLQETLRRDVHASLALDRLDQDRSGLQSDELLRCLEVAKRRVDEAIEHRAEPFLQVRLGGRTQAAVGATVEGFGEGQDLILSRSVILGGVLAGELYRRLDALGAGVAEEDLIEICALG